MQSYVDDSWPELPGTSCSNTGHRVRSVKKFSHVVKKENIRFLKVDTTESKTLLRDKESEQVLRDTEETINVQHTSDKINAKFVKETSQELKKDFRKQLIKNQTSEKTEKEVSTERPQQKNRVSKQLLKDEKKRAKEEEIRRNMVAPKGQKVRVVNQKMLEVLLNNNVSFVNRKTVIPALSDTDFPSVEESRKQRVKPNDSNIEQETADVPVKKRIKKRKDPVFIDLVKLIKRKPKRAQNNIGRIQKRDGFNSYSGNQLDASNPERRRGKTREKPKLRKPSELKCAILEARELRRKLKAITSGLENLNIENDSEPLKNQLEDLKINQPVCLPIHSRKFREYCDNRLTPRLNDALRQLLKDIVKFQDRQYHKNPVKAFAKRRYISGFREVKKQLSLKKVKLLIIAPDLEVAKTKGGIDEIVAELKDAAKEQNVLCAFALSRRELGYLTFKKVGISCIGICNYDGSENNYQEVLAALAEAKESYQLEISSNAGIESDVTNKVITSLLSKFSESESPFLSAIENKSNSEEEREILGEQPVQTADE